MVFKNKKYFWLTVLMILMIFVSTSCKKEEEVIKESKEQTESTDDKKENKKEVGSKKKENTVSKKPHIILEEVHDGNFDMENYRYLYTMSSVHFKLREEDKEFEALRNALNEYNDMVDIRFKEIKEELEEYSQNDKDSEYPSTTRYIETKSYVMRADEDIVSILNYEIEEQGIRHPIETRTSYNFDTKTGEQIYIYNAQQLKMKKEEVEYIRKIEKAVSLSKFDEIDREKNPVLTEERNIDLYEKIQKKIEKTVYKHRLTSIENSLIDGKQKFVNLDFEKQCKILNSILYNLTKTFKADLRDIGGSENSGGCLCSKNINNYKEFKLIQQSITGLYSCEKDLMTI